MTIDNHSVTQFEDILNYLEEHKKAGDNVYLTTLRDGKLRTNLILFLMLGPVSKKMINRYSGVLEKNKESFCLFFLL